MKQFLSLFVFLFATYSSLLAEEKDSVRHWGMAVSVMPSEVVALDSYDKRWLNKRANGSVAIAFNHVALPSDSDAYAKDFGYPSLSIGLRYTFNGAVKMRRSEDKAWGMAQMVDYDSRLGNTLSVYGTFTRAIYRNRKWETSYALSGGIGFNTQWYDKANNIDNELIGTPILIYFGAGLFQTYRFSQSWGVRAGIEFVHHSNGALYRPNKGSNTIGPSLGLVYYPYYEAQVRDRNMYKSEPFKKSLYLNISLGIGGKTMLEDWLLTQFQTPPTDPNYRTEDFKFYMAYSLQADLMYRYARRWASGIGMDLFYGSYASHIKALDTAKGIEMRHSPWSLGLAGKHEVFYHNLSLAMSLGFYLHRQMGANAKENETPYYERIGVHYTFKSLQGLKLGINVKAHRTKADLTEIVLVYPIRIK